MPYLWHSLRRKVIPKGAPPRLRPELGRARFALLPPTGSGSGVPTETQVGPAVPYLLPWHASGTIMAIETNKFGPAFRTTDSSASPINGWYSAATTPVSGLTESTIIVVGDQLTSANNDAGIAACLTGGDTTEIGIGATNGWIVRLRQSSYGTLTSCAFTGTQAGPASACWSWKGASWNAYRNGIVADSVIGGVTSIVTSTTWSVLGRGSYTRGVQINMIIWTDRAVPAPLAHAVSLNPYDAFLPVNRSFYYTAAGDSEAPTWPGGSTVDPSSVTHNAMTITWDAATDNVGVTQYRYRLNAGAWTTLGNVLTTNLSGLTPAVSYTIDVQAGDANSNWSASLSVTQATDEIGIQPTIYNASNGTARANETGIKVLVLGEAPGSTATPTVLAYSAAETTDGSGVLDVRLNSSGLDPADIVWLVAIKSDGVPGNSGWAVAWPQAVVAI